MLYGIRISQYLEIPHNTLLAVQNQTRWQHQKVGRNG